MLLLAVVWHKTTMASVELGGAGHVLSKSMKKNCEDLGEGTCDIKNHCNDGGKEGSILYVFKSFPPRYQGWNYLSWEKPNLPKVEATVSAAGQI